jgi:ribosomal protein L11 methylase PrmA
VNHSYRENYELLIRSGLYDAAVAAGLLIPHVETSLSTSPDGLAYKVIQPERVAFISYPYEWSFSQLKHAALATLDIQKRSLNFGMSLKDASAYNIQFHKGRPVLIDTLSFEKYQEGAAWVAYRQFCQHFLAPLALMAHTDVRLSQWFRIHMDGVPLDLASRLLPLRTRLKIPLLTHIHLHARSQKHFSDKIVDMGRFKLSRAALLRVLDHLRSALEALSWKPRGTEWADYYKGVNYCPQSFDEKRRIVTDFIGVARPRTVWDLGANTGVFSRIAGDCSVDTIAFDIDPAAVERNYLDCVANGDIRILPLVLDLTNPSPAIGWNLEERMSLRDRGPADMLLALALVHHLAISNNVPLEQIAAFFHGIGKSLVVEFVPKSDSQVRKLLATRKDVFPDYRREIFEQAFSRYFEVLRVMEIPNSERTLYLMQKKKVS